jgi:hypothetical protein
MPTQFRLKNDVTTYGLKTLIYVDMMGELMYRELTGLKYR